MIPVFSVGLVALSCSFSHAIALTLNTAPDVTVARRGGATDITAATVIADERGVEVKGAKTLEFIPWDEVRAFVGTPQLSGALVSSRTDSLAAQLALGEDLWRARQRSSRVHCWPHTGRNCARSMDQRRRLPQRPCCSARCITKILARQLCLGSKCCVTVPRANPRASRPTRRPSMRKQACSARSRHSFPLRGESNFSMRVAARNIVRKAIQQAPTRLRSPLRR